MTCPNYAEFSSLDSCQNRFLWVVDLVLHPVVGLVLDLVVGLVLDLVVGLVLQVRDAKSFLQAFAYIRAKRVRITVHL